MAPLTPMLPLFVVLHVLSGPAAGPRAEVPQHSPTRAQAAQVQPSLDGPWQARQLACHSSRGAPCDDATLLVLQAVARAHWPEAWAYSALLADEANHQSDSHEAVKLAAAAYAMAPHRPAAQWAQVFALWRHRDWLPALAAAFQAVSALLGRSGHSVGVWVLPAYGAALTALMGFAALVFVLLAHAGPLLSHDIGHLLPKPLRPATTLVLAAISLGLWAVMGSPSAWGPVLTTTALAWPVVLYLSPSWRSRLATSSIILAATMLVLPHMLAPAGFVASAAGARFRALTDATAPWAQERLEPAHEAQGYDLWAQALLATRHLDGEGARALAERAISAGETHPALLVLEANLLWERKDFVRAKAFYEQALSQQPQDAVARYNLSQTLLSLADPRAAEVARLQAFADGGHVLTEQAARAQAAGHLLLDPQIPVELQRWSPQEPLMAEGRLAWAAMAPWVAGTMDVRWVLLMLLALAAAHGVISLVSLEPALRDKATAVLPLTGRCSRCHALSCPRCAPSAWEAGLCGPCQRAALGADDEAIALRDTQEAASLWHYRSSQLLQQAATWLLPGVGIALQRSWLMGQLTWMLFATCALGALYARQVLPVPFALWAQNTGPSSQVLLGACVGIAACTWVMAMIFGRRER